jgi:NTE family protein
MSSMLHAPSLIRRLALCVGLCAAVVCSACSTSHYFINPAQQADTTEAQGYAFRNMRADDNSDSLFVAMALSGGGYRAAALAHAVMEALSETPIRWDGRRGSLLDEVDVISAVSGGSLAAAHFALNRESFISEFPRRVLSLDLQSLLLQRVLSPGGVWRQSSKNFGRGDLLQEVLEEQVFHGQRFAQVPRRRPMIYINSTDMRHGQRFEFTQDQFDHLCSDLDALPVARAVAASMAVPVLLSPITLWNHRSSCPAPRHLRPVSGQAASSRYIHLVDGGLADNTGLDAVLDNVAVRGNLRKTAEAVRLHGLRKRVIIVVNAQVVTHKSEPDSPHTPGLLRQIRSLVNVPIDRHADAKVQQLSETVKQRRAELVQTSNPALRDAVDGFHIVEVNLASASDPELADRLQRIPTGLRIEPDQIAHIRRFVREQLASNPQWQRLLTEIKEPFGSEQNVAME